MAGHLQAQSHTPLYSLYQCALCTALIQHQMTIDRPFNYGRCHCGGPLRAVHTAVHAAVFRHKVTV